MTSGKLDFNTITLQDALDIAIVIEDEAKERYEELAAQLETHRTTEAAEFFRVMVGNEQRHGDRLRQQRRALFGDAPARIDRTAVPQLESIDYAEVRAFMTPHQALRIALKAENRAHDFYLGALGTVGNEQVRRLFTELHAEEVGHLALVSHQLAGLPPEDRTNPDDFVDEPMPQ